MLYLCIYVGFLPPNMQRFFNFKVGIRFSSISTLNRAVITTIFPGFRPLKMYKYMFKYNNLLYHCYLYIEIL